METVILFRKLCDKVTMVDQLDRYIVDPVVCIGSFQLSTGCKSEVGELFFELWCILKLGIDIVLFEMNDAMSLQ